MGKDLSVAVLFDFYGDLLTEKQAQAIDLYYNEDLSLAEIASPLGISRQGVRDAIKRGEKQLRAFEETLGLAQRFKDVKGDVAEISQMFAEMQRYIDTYIHSEKLSGAVEQIGNKLAAITDKL